MTDLHTALAELLAHYVRLVESGDAGHWDAESEPVVKRARAALDAVQAQPVACVTVKSIVPGRIDDLEVLQPLPRGQHLLYTTPQAPQIPAGWKLVPVNPTEAMLRACIYNTDKDSEGEWSAAEGNYRAMLAAAPSPQAPQPLTDEQILAMVKAAPALDTAEAEWLHVARAIERAHGIGGQP